MEGKSNSLEEVLVPQKGLIKGFEVILPLPRSTLEEEMFRFGFSKFKHEVPSEVHSRILTAEKPSGCADRERLVRWLHMDADAGGRSV
jgi:hypothetical protein